MSWIKHAFALDDGKGGPTPEQKEVVEKVCRQVVRRGLTTPALVSLEVFRPLNYVGSQAMHFFRPIVNIVLDGEGYRHFAEFLETRDSVEYLRERLEAIEDETQKAEALKTAPATPDKPKNPSS